MHEFETFVYLDMEKTGSSFISMLLRKFCAEQEIRFLHHNPMEADCDRAKFYFISVRDPLDAYLSLYSFGCQRQGKVRTQLRLRGLDDLYDRTTEGFHAWLSFVLNPTNADALGGRYAAIGGGALAALMGLQSYRYLKLAIPGAETVLARCATPDDVRAAHAANRLPTYTIRHESFTADLAELLRGKLAYAMADADGALRFVESARKINASRRVDAGEGDFALGDVLQARLWQREWFLRELFAY